MSEARQLSVELAEAVADVLLAEARRERQERRETVAMIRRCLVGRYYPSPWLFHAGSALDGTLGAVTNNSGIGAPGHAQRWNDGPVDGTPLPGAGCRMPAVPMAHLGGSPRRSTQEILIPILFLPTIGPLMHCRGRRRRRAPVGGTRVTTGSNPRGVDSALISKCCRGACGLPGYCFRGYPVGSYSFQVCCVPSLYSHL